jgi:hypothetical protein
VVPWWPCRLPRGVEILTYCTVQACAHSNASFGGPWPAAGASRCRRAPAMPTQHAWHGVTERIRSDITRTQHAWLSLFFSGGSGRLLGAPPIPAGTIVGWASDDSRLEMTIPMVLLSRIHTHDTKNSIESPIYTLVDIDLPLYLYPCEYGSLVPTKIKHLSKYYIIQMSSISI